MGCRKGCGSDAQLIELIVKDLIRQMIDKGLLQEGLTDCNSERLFKDRKVITCESLKDRICEMVEEGDLCFSQPTALTFDKETNTLSLLSSGGADPISTTIPLPPSIKSVTADKATKNIIITLSDDSTKTVDLSEMLGDIITVAKDDQTGDVTLTAMGKAPVVIPAVKVDIVESDDKFTFTKQDGSQVEVPKHKASVRITNAFGNVTIGHIHTDDERG